MNSEFKIYKLGNVATIFAGGDKPKAFSEVKNFEFNIPVYANGETNDGLQGYTNKAKVNEQAVTVSARGTIGYAVLRKEPFVPIVRLLTLIPKKDLLDIGFLYYYLKLYRQKGIGSSQAQLIVPELSKRTISIPLLPTQKSIAKVLSSLDAKIELNNRINAELELMAKTIYDYWFVQFDFPNEQGKPYKSSGGKMVWNEELKREIPEGWKNGTLVDIAELVRGVTYDASEIKNESDSDVIPILRATNISGNVIDLNNMVFVPTQNVSPNQVLNKYDILITMSSGSKEHIGKNGFFFYNQKVSFGAFCAKIVARTNFQFYLYSYCQSDFMFSTIKNECLGTNINNLTGSLVKGFKIAIPLNKYIDLFNRKVCSIYEKIGNNLIENQHLTELRDWLLPMLMNGQVSVKGMEEEIGMAAEGGGANMIIM